MLPKIDGLEVCRRLRSRSSVPIIMLTAKSEEIDKVVGLELGADDYITKPFSLREFSSRIKAALRRAEMTRPAETAPDEAPLEVLQLRIDFPKRTVRVRGIDAQLTYVEFEILSALARNPGRVFTRDMLLDVNTANGQPQLSTPVVDSNPGTDEAMTFPLAYQAVQSGKPEAGTEEVAGVTVAEAAYPIRSHGQILAVAVYSSSVADVI